MSEGLKQMAAEAVSGNPGARTSSQVQHVASEQAIQPVKVSGAAHKALANIARRWSGWSDAVLLLAEPPTKVSRYGSTDMRSHTIHLNVDALCRNPNRVLNNLTPFRLRQEALITGVLMHEAAHARFTRWTPTRVEDLPGFVHGSGSVHAGEPVNEPTLRFALLMEEARIEARMVSQDRAVGGYDLGWTMLAAGRAISPVTNISADPDQQVMDVIESWLLRAGKQRAHSAGQWPIPWVNLYGALLKDEVLTSHFENLGAPYPRVEAKEVFDLLTAMIECTDDTGTFMMDTAREILDRLFPETDPDQAPTPGGGCGTAQAGMPKHELDDESESGDSAGTEQEQTDAEEGEGGDGEGQPGEGPADLAGDEADATPAQQAAQQAVANAIQALETQADRAQGAAEKSEAAKAPEPPKSSGSGAGSALNPTKAGGANFRNPTPAERGIQRGAEKFLRDMISPTVTNKVRTTASPSSAIDAAAYSAWKAAGQTTAPTFFRNTKRLITSSPPVRVAVLVDKSMSMDALSEPSSLLSWALSSAAYDLRNFAGHGVQVESCLIHWGDNARVVQANGSVLRGIYADRCREYTDAMGKAFDLVEQQMPGFFDAPEKPANRLLVHFTDWILGNKSAVPRQAQALVNGVNTLSVVPRDYDVRRSNLNDVIRQVGTSTTGVSALLKYDPRNPELIWSRAAELLS